MTTIIHLSDEIIATILENKNISVEDIVNLKSTCKRLQHVTFSTKFWEKKYFQRFPLSKRIHNKNKLKKIVNYLKVGVKCIQKLRHYVSLMSYNNLRDVKEMELNKLLSFIAGHSTIYHIVLDDMNRIISAQLSRHDSNLTVKYYFDLIYHWLEQYRLVYKQRKFIFMPKEKQLLEKQITIIAQYFQPCVSYSIIDTWLNDIVQEVLTCLKNRYPTHSVFSTSSEQFTLWRYNNINDNFWNLTEAKQIMYILEIMVSNFIVHQVHQLLVTLEVERKYVNFILEHFQGCLLAIIFHSVARRFGLCCFLSYKYDFEMAIVWKPKYYREGQSEEYFYTTSFPRSITREVCHLDIHPQNPLYNITQIRNLIFDLCKLREHCNVCTDLQLKHQVSYKWKLMYMWNFLSLCCDNIEDIQTDYEYRNITSSIQDRLNIVIDKPEIRKEEIEFTIGMIVMFSTYEYLFPFISHQHGVIIGWHDKCKATLVKEKLYSLVPHLRDCYSNQNICLCRCQTATDNSRFICRPHYIILADNNIMCYVSQDMIHTSSPQKINNVEIGRYFSKFEGTYYVPNENLARNYPTDIAVMREIFSN